MALTVFKDETQTKAWDPIPDHPIAQSLVIAALIFGICILGIHTRLLFSLASIWPANSVLLGFLLVRTQANTPLTWLLVAIAYVSADLLSGSALIPAIALNAINLAAVAAGVLTGWVIRKNAVLVSRPFDAISMVMVITAASAVAALCGAFAGPALFGLDWGTSAGLWFSVEFVNFAIYLPIALTLASSDPDKLRFVSRTPVRARQQAAAIAALFVTVLFMHWIGGPLAGAYMVPAILWCAIVYRPAAAAIIAMLACTWVLIAGPLNLFPLRIDFSQATDAASFRLGVGMIALGAFAVSTINAAWREANNELRYIASHDALTGLLNRGAFMQRLSARVTKEQGRFCLLMLDIDRFKAVNDTYGHMTGDRALQALALRIQMHMQPSDFAGRLGGEEFAIVINQSLAGGTAELAESLRVSIAKASVTSDQGEEIRFTISMGLTEGTAGEDVSLLLSAADSALYAAKHGGRDRIVIVPGAKPSTTPPSVSPLNERRLRRALAS